MPAKMLCSQSPGANLSSYPDECLMKASPVAARVPLVSAMEMPPSSGMLLRDEQKMVDIEQPHHHDVLCGRGVTTNRHPGNESFRSLVSLNKVSEIGFGIFSNSLFQNFSRRNLLANFLQGIFEIHAEGTKTFCA